MRGPAALASFYASQERWKDARAVFETRLAANQSDAFAVFQLGRVLQLEGADLRRCARPFRAVPLRAAAPAPSPTHADAWFRKGEVLLQLGRKAEAVAAFEAALKLAPGHRGAAGALARASQKR